MPTALFEARPRGNSPKENSMVLDHGGASLALLHVRRGNCISPALVKLEGTGQDEARAGSEHNPFILPLNEEPSGEGGLL